MSRPNYNEADTLRKGFATAAVQDGASEGDMPAVGSDGELAFGAGGGGTLPDWWIVDSTPGEEDLALAGSLDVNPPEAEDAGGITVTAPASYDSIVGVLVQSSDGTVRTQMNPDFVRSFSATFNGLAGGHDQIVLIAVHSNDTDRTQDICQFYKASGAAGLWGVQKDGFEYMQDNGLSVPADGDVQNSQRVQGYDATEGAPALMFKQRDVAGNLVTGKSAAMSADGTSFLGVAKPTVPLTTPSVQDVIDVLVTLDLIIQSD